MKRFASLFILLLFTPLTFTEPQVSVTINPSLAGHTRTHNLLSTNLPTWINRSHAADPGFIIRADQSWTTLVRFPGGSWSNSFQLDPWETLVSGIDNTTLSLMAVNKTGNPIDATISVNGNRIQSALLDYAGADSLSTTTIVYNGVSEPNVDFSNAPPLALQAPEGGLVNHTFPKYSVSMLQLSVEDTRGDMNGDKTIDLYDLMLVLKTLTDQSMNQITTDGDINDNNRIGLEEAIFLLREIGGTPAP
ncbi:hypothetical protein [Desulfopila sp. IMCC35008]|uniref:hypothetical protein n=1 Tax=Desulfopila sp. IMCC35008 TaxID=2653858 RepID=UPI0013D0274F|nr:hypothetical protein [Desulfopila sp. IMCC35008]